MLLEKDVMLMFDEKCMLAFQILKSTIVSAPIIITLDRSALFELICDTSDYVIRAILGQKNKK